MWQIIVGGIVLCIIGVFGYILKVMNTSLKLQYGSGSKHDEFRYQFYASRNLCDPRRCPYAGLEHKRCERSENRIKG